MTKQQPKHKLTASIVLASWLVANPVPANTTDDLPDLGDASSAIVSPEQEYRLGRAWLRQLRAQAPLIHDPLLFDYLHNLVYRLASASDIEKPDLELVLINSSDINAFAVPGGVMGFNGGLLLNARSEDEVGGVIAHELAHLSQRHFARGVERSQQTSWAGLAALLASIAVAVAAGGEAGMAAMATTQAASIDAQLRFSRANEQEADRIGMQTLVRAGMNPEAMADFFEALQRSMRYYGELPPEFLLTHPVTESRITDARARAATYPPHPSSDSLEFHLMKVRVEVEFAKDTNSAIRNFEQEKQQSESWLEITEYGLSCAYLKSNELEKALKSINALLAKRPDRITYIASKAEILNKSGRYDDAIELLEKGLAYSPGNYALSVHYADALNLKGESEKAINIIREQLTQWETQPLLWHMLAEAEGKQGNRLGVYQAKAEYFFLYGHTQKAIEQLQYALPLARDDFHVTARISDRIDEMRQSMADMNF